MPSVKKQKVVSHVPAHAVTWMAVLAMVFSGATLTLAASAQGATVSVCNQNSIAGLRCLIGQLNTKLDLILAKLDAQSQACTQAAASTASNTQCEPAPTTDNGGSRALEAPTPQPAPTPTQTKTQAAPPIDPVVCKQKCEDEFNACAKQAGQDQQKYMVCKNNLYACFTPCGL